MVFFGSPTAVSSDIDVGGPGMELIPMILIRDVDGDWAFAEASTGTPAGYAIRDADGDIAYSAEATSGLTIVMNGGEIFIY